MVLKCFVGGVTRQKFNTRNSFTNEQINREGN